MWKVIGIPLVLYLIFALYIHQPTPPEEILVAELIKEMPVISFAGQ